MALARASLAGAKMQRGVAVSRHAQCARPLSCKSPSRKTLTAAPTNAPRAPREECAMARPKSMLCPGTGSPTVGGQRVPGGRLPNTPPLCTNVSRQATARGVPTPPVTLDTTAPCAPPAPKAGRWLRGHAWNARVAQGARRCGPCSSSFSAAVVPASRVASFAPRRTNL